MRTRVCYLEIQQSHGKQGIFVSVAFVFNCGCWKTRYVSERLVKFVMNFLKGVVSTLLLVDVVLNNGSIKVPQQNFHEILYMNCYILTVCNCLYKQCITTCTLH